MKYKIEYREEGYILIDADDVMQAENTFELEHNNNPTAFRRILDTNPVAINAKGEVFELRELVKVPDDELGPDFWHIAAIYEDMVLCIQKDDNCKIIAEQEVPCSILEKACKL